MNFSIYNNFSNFKSIQIKEKKQYQNFIKHIFKYADEICFIADPCLDTLEELLDTKWNFLYKSVICYEYTPYVPYTSNSTALFPKCVLHLKTDYQTLEFFKNKANIFDFDWSNGDRATGIMLVDPFFLHNGKVICSTLTHEQFLDVHPMIIE